mmetsp:Transcript_9647/g.12745  ORF Transcript_9647/g.12745 Transcript_9647/m.12745 type:complete len:142 (+) Transcript_9647:331-756(+)
MKKPKQRKDPLKRIKKPKQRKESDEESKEAGIKAEGTSPNKKEQNDECGYDRESDEEDYNKPTKLDSTEVAGDSSEEEEKEEEENNGDEEDVEDESPGQEPQNVQELSLRQLNTKMRQKSLKSVAEKNTCFPGKIVLARDF